MFRYLLAIILSSLLFGCGGGGSTDNYSAGAAETESSCPDSMQCDFFSVPEDYNNDTGKMVKIHYGIHKATDIENRIGILVFNFGGPGGEAVSGTNWMVEEKLPVEILARFDVIGMDPRGTGQSAFAKELTDCAVAEANHNGNCSHVFANFAPYLGSNSVVKDLDQLRLVLGEDKLNFFGYSYGTRLGALYANMYPENVRAIVLDSPMSPNDKNYFEIAKGNIKGLDMVVDYRLGFDPIKKAQFININNTAEQFAFYDATDGVSLNSNEANSALWATVGKEHLGDWSKIKSGLFDLLENDNAQMLKTQLPTLYSHATTEDDLRSNMLFNAVVCTDESAPLSENEILSKQYEYDAFSALFTSTAKSWSTMCADWPYQQDPIAVVENMRSVLTDQKILIIAGKYDTNTAYFWGTKMAAAFGELASMVTVDNLADHGFSYTGISCVDKNTTQYLLDPTIKITDQTCDGAVLNKSRASIIKSGQHPAKRINRHRY